MKDDVNETKGDPNYERLVEAGWRRALSAAEETELRELLALDPARQGDWDQERRLSRALDRLPDAPVASNFTARVMQSVERACPGGSAAPAGSRARGLWRRLAGWMGAGGAGHGAPRGLVPAGSRWLWRGAAVAVLTISGLASYRHFESLQREQLAESAAAVSEIAALPPDVLRDFDAIQALASNPGADEQLLALMAGTRE